MSEPLVALPTKEEVLEFRASLRGLREILFANAVMAGELPAPTGAEELLTRFLSDRFTEAGLTDIAKDQAGNIAGVIPGRDSSKNILIAAHVDKIWGDADDHTVSVEVGKMSGRGVADNSLGVAVLATLPSIVEKLGLRFESNLILLGTTRSFGRGDIGGIRFFLDHTDRRISSALCVEGIDLGRLSYSSLGMARGEIVAELRGEASSVDQLTSGVIGVLHELVSGLLAINSEEFPDARILIGSVDAVSGYNVPPVHGVLRFEIRAETQKAVDRVRKEIKKLVQEKGTTCGEIDLSFEVIARRKPGKLREDNPIVSQAREVMKWLEIEPRIEPSISELAALLANDIPALTLGITEGANRHTPRESILLEPVFDGLAQIVAVLCTMDALGGGDSE